LEKQSDTVVKYLTISRPAGIGNTVQKKQIASFEQAAKLLALKSAYTDFKVCLLFNSPRTAELFPAEGERSPPDGLF